MGLQEAAQLVERLRRGGQVDGHVVGDVGEMGRVVVHDLGAKLFRELFHPGYVGLDLGVAAQPGRSVIIRW
ncbi:hypothetical protein [Phytohabitans houttuyneae]|uniref:hypothetical protein n=1 Tax=Phytohabitans houttuyneae TaxID=1076126 RepID=UPI001565F178|nr:hypothetical protein [Phytohabitans houttuyneae]